MASRGPTPNPYDPYQPGADPSGPYSQGGYLSGPPMTVPRDPHSKLPTFCMVMFIIDLVFCGLRVVAVLFGIVAYASSMMQNDPLTETGLAEIITGIGIAVFGLLGNGLMLAKKPVGQYLAWLAVLFTIGSVGVGVWQASIQFENPPPMLQEGPKEAMLIGAALGLLIRVALLGVYVAALIRFNRFVREMPQSPTDDPAYWSQTY